MNITKIPLGKPRYSGKDKRLCDRSFYANHVLIRESIRGESSLD